MSSYGFPKKAEDAASANGDYLVPIAGVRKDGNDTAQTGTDGDFGWITLNDVGNLKVQIEPTRKATYSAQSAIFTPASSATDFSCMVGSASKIIKIYRIEFLSLNGSSATAYNNPDIVRRSTDNTGGTSTSPTAVKFDSSSASATATIRNYTANPSSLGTSAGLIKTSMTSPVYSATYSTVTVGMPFNHVIFDAAQSGLVQPIVLRGTSEVCALNHAGVSFTAAAGILVRWVWTEE